MTRYDYGELREKALAPNATFEDKVDLACWFDNYDPSAWNGECYDLGDGVTMWPMCSVDGEPDENGDYPIVDYKIF